MKGGKNKMEQNETVPKTIRESIDRCREKLREEGYTQENQPCDNHPFRMKADIDTIRRSLLSSGKFASTDSRSDLWTELYGENRLRSIPHGTAVNLKNGIYDDVRSDEIAEGWIYSTIHFACYNPDGTRWELRSKETRFESTLDTIEDLLSVAEANRIPMKTIHRQRTQNSYGCEVTYIPDGDAPADIGREE